MERFSVVDTMPMITVEADDTTPAAGHIVVKGVADSDTGEKAVDAGDTMDTDGMARIIEGGHIIANGTDNTHATTQIIATTDGTQIFTSESGHMMASDTGQLISAEHNIFSDSGSDIIANGSGHIIMDSDGVGSIIHSTGQGIAEAGKAHVVSTDGDMIAVDGSLLDGSHSLRSHVSEVRWRKWMFEMYLNYIPHLFHLLFMYFSHCIDYNTTHIFKGNKEQKILSKQ